MVHMKIIVGTPRSGTSFIAQWYANQYPDHTYHMPEKLGEYFHPDFMDGDETAERIKNLTDKSIFKLHTGKEMSPLIWEFIADKEVILVERGSKFQQFLSYGIGYLTNRWVSYIREGNNGLTAPGYYKKQWFDELEQRLVEFNERTFISKTHYWYEDIYKLPANGQLPLKQNLGNKLDAFTNKDEVVEWYQDFNKRTGLGH